jgi:hypothetical protein
MNRVVSCEVEQLDIERTPDDSNTSSSKSFENSQ